MSEPAREEVISERYRLVRELGRGGMGAVWEAVDERLGRRVAVKLMIQRLARDDKALRRFEREAKAVASLRSPHIVQLLDFGIDRVPYMVLELLEGCELKERLLEVERLPLVAVARVVAQAAKALSTAHAAGIVHRDLKPANIFLVEDGDDEYVKVFDFGTAKALTGFKDARTLTTLGSILGTPHYMAPEQLSGDDDTDHRADIWSLGVVSYHALTGVHPFPGEIGEVIQGIVFSGHTPPSALDPDLPAALDTFFETALAKKPDARFASARALADALAAIADAGASQGPARRPADPESEEERAVDALALRAGATTRRGLPASLEGAGRPPSPEEADQAAASAWARSSLDTASVAGPLSTRTPEATPAALVRAHSRLPRTAIGLGAALSVLAGGVAAWLALDPAPAAAPNAPAAPSAAPVDSAAPSAPAAPSSSPPRTSATASASATAAPVRPRPWRRPDIYEGLDRDIYK
jgi:serine/threonine-protein kinase